jgi:hypothetical protein
MGIITTILHDMGLISRPDDYVSLTKNTTNNDDGHM